ncbi:MAG TPA: tyrosine-type recombinase/integrase [Kiritimatiellia bacterium]|nr:tyrosine-type recombinase/integrase [Kiritimatiellia bacterium]HMO99241.1 tyrosine-type recombinase/integrase [Kiritimatiellia bacterium]HMO99246.1 tyrosine-type recombinase/integrase [Kiritimatiellia bacterium]HMP96962.1 tyrosine-type recombinase/integrase [Kiritimatiellia bacterium]
MITRRHSLSRDPRTGIFYAKIQVDKIRRRFTFGKNRKAAESALRKLERELVTGEMSFCEQPTAPTAPPETGLLLSELIAKHLEWVLNNRSRGTYEVRRHFLTGFKKFTGECPVNRIDRITLENFVAWARKHHAKSGNGGVAYLRHVKTMFLWADEVGLCPCPVRRFPRATEAAAPTRRFTDDELEKLFRQVSSGFKDFRDMVYFGLLTGLRPQELRQLQRDHILRDSEGNFFVMIQEHKTARTARQPMGRSVPLTDEAAEIVRRQLHAHTSSSFVFLNADSKPYKAHTFRQRFMRWCKRAEVAPRPPYALRHTFGSMEAEANINQTSLSQLMGHTTIRTTARYISNNYDHHRNAIGAIVGRVKTLTGPTLTVLDKTA